MRIPLMVGVGSALGGLVRYGLDAATLWVVGTAFLPVATFIINVSGSFLIGCLAGRWAGSEANSVKWHFWATGICGGFTTFSAFTWQVLELVRSGNGQLAGLYAACSMGFGMLAAWIGLSWSIRARQADITVENKANLP